MVWHLKIGPKMRVWESNLYFGDIFIKTQKNQKPLAGAPWNLFWVTQMVPMDIPKGPWGISAIKFFRWSQYQISAHYMRYECATLTVLWCIPRPGTAQNTWPDSCGLLHPTQTLAPAGSFLQYSRLAPWLLSWSPGVLSLETYLQTCAGWSSSSDSLS